MESIRIQKQPEYQPRYKKKSSSKKKVSMGKKIKPKLSNKKKGVSILKKKQPLKTGTRKIFK